MFTNPRFQIIDTGRAESVRTVASLNATIAIAARLTGQPERLIEVALEFNTPTLPITRIPAKMGTSDTTSVKIVRS